MEWAEQRPAAQLKIFDFYGAGVFDGLVLLFSFFGGLWPLLRQGLRQRERTNKQNQFKSNQTFHNERSESNQSIISFQSTNNFSSLMKKELMGWWMKCWGWLNKWGAKAGSSAAVSEWMESIDGGRKERRQINWRNEWWGCLIYWKDGLWLGAQPSAAAELHSGMFSFLHFVSFAFWFHLPQRRQATPIN